MATSRLVLALALVGVLSGGAARGEAPAATMPAIDPAATAALEQMSKQLAAAETFTFEADSEVEQVLPSGQKVQFAKRQTVAVQRPRALASTVIGDHEDYGFLYDGRTFTIFNRLAKVYAQGAAPDTIDAALDVLAQKHGMVLPLADLLFSDPYKVMAAEIRAGQDLGMSDVFETKCRHLAFRQDTVDWQIWIDAGSLPRKLVITYKLAPASPQYTAYFRNWKLAAKLPSETFGPFIPPADAKRIAFAASGKSVTPARPPATQPAALAP